VPTYHLAGATLDYEVRGEDGPAVVQLHGLTSSRRRETELGVDLSAGLSGCRVLRYDARGHGRSTGSPDPAAYSWPCLAEDLRSLLDAVLPGETVHGIGASMGVGTLLHAVVADPARFRSLVLAIPPTAWETRTQQRAAYLQASELVRHEGIAPWVEAGRGAPPPPASPGLGTAWPQVEEDLLPAVLAGAAETDLPAPEVVAALDLPVLLLAWTDDLAHPLSTARRLHELVAGSELVVAATQDDRVAWRGHVADWVARHAG
jgi:pimeloyl-ACP methyl ester carboxylesterase